MASAPIRFEWDRPLTVREDLLARLLGLLRARRLAIESHMLADFTINAVAKTLFVRLNPDDEWEDASAAMKATFREDAIAAITTAFGAVREPSEDAAHG